MSDAVETVNQSDYLDISSKLFNNVQAQEQEVKDCTEFLKIAFRKYRQCTIILEAIKECLEDSNNLDDRLKNKINDIVLSDQLSQIRLTNNSGEAKPNEAILGVSLPNNELTYSESNELQMCLKSKLDSKYQKLKATYSSVLGKHFNNASYEEINNPLDVAHEDLELIDFKQKLIVEQECYIKNQIQLLDLLEDLKSVRLSTVPDLAEQKIDECRLRSKINHLKSLLATEKSRVDIFLETSYSLKAYTELIRDIKEQQEELQVEIRKLKELKGKYAQVSCLEYNGILKSYLQYKSALEKKKKMYECIHGKP